MQVQVEEVTDKMANEDFFESFLRNSSNYNGVPEYYEDTHDAQGNYVGARQQTAAGYAPAGASVARDGGVSAAPQSKPLPVAEQFLSPKYNSQNFVIYHPRTTADVEQLIAYLRRGEAALVDLDPISELPEAQRLMDFTSGAAYALGARVLSVRRNLFLITSEGVDVLRPERDD